MTLGSRDLLKLPGMRFKYKEGGIYFEGEIKSAETETQIMEPKYLW